MSDWIHTMYAKHAESQAVLARRDKVIQDECYGLARRLFAQLDADAKLIKQNSPEARLEVTHSDYSAQITKNSEPVMALDINIQCGPKEIRIQRRRFETRNSQPTETMDILGIDVAPDNGIYIKNIGGESMEVSEVCQYILEPLIDCIFGYPEKRKS